MTPTTAGDQRLAHRIAAMMRIGTAIAAALLVAGTGFEYGGLTLAAKALFIGGCGLLILLPALRLAMMARHYVRHAQRYFAAITLTVLTLVIAGVVLGIVQ